MATTPSRTKFYDVAYAPYGEDYNGSGTQDLGFTDQNQDTVKNGWSTNLYDFMFREYRTAHGRWTSPDPSGLTAVDPSNPQSWNRYAYVVNNPLAMIDLLGDQCYDLSGAAMDCWPGYADGAALPTGSVQQSVTVSANDNSSDPGSSNSGVPDSVSVGSTSNNSGTGGANGTGNSGGGTMSNPTQTTPQQKKQAICTTLAKVSNVSTGLAKLTAVGAGVAAASILYTGGTNTEVAGPIAIGLTATAGGFQTFSLLNTAIANWGVGCHNSW